MILLNPAERVEILTVIDNVMDVPPHSTDVAKPMEASGCERPSFVEAPLLESGHAAATL